VVSALDLDRNDFDKALQRFIRSLPGSELSVFYYSGHGIQVGGDNRIIPIDAKLKDPADLEIETINVKTIISYMQQNSKTQLVYLDSALSVLKRGHDGDEASFSNYSVKRANKKFDGWWYILRTKYSTCDFRQPEADAISKAIRSF